jgi:hypothetical protein
MKPTSESVTKLASEWLIAEMEPHGRKNFQDEAILVYRMVSTFKLSIDQYWVIANNWLEVANTEQDTEMFWRRWISTQVWQALTDWNGTGESLQTLLTTALTALHVNENQLSPPNEHLIITALRKSAAKLAPALSWDSLSLKAWYADTKNSFEKWTLGDIKALSKDAHGSLLEAYMLRALNHDRIELKAVQTLISGHRWSRTQLQATISKYLTRCNFAKPELQTKVIFGAWLDTLDWSSEMASKNMRQVSEMLINDYNRELWNFALPKIGKGLVSYKGDPRVLIDNNHVTRTGSMCGHIVASIDAVLPSELTLFAVSRGGLITILLNTRYSMATRLAFLSEHADSIVPNGRAGSFLKTLKVLENPLKGAFALWCFMSANSDRYDYSYWDAAGITRSAAAKPRFLEIHAPEALKQINVVETLSLSYAAALDLYLGSLNFHGAQQSIELPELNDNL